ncbi:hypothetical protein Mrose_03458 [Calidithermus roseus]|uniref:Uncharacterized protein n=1 Tax=Calidithermus roseus TaxID=1644118 RepID=A0A399EBW3_9DEIN|nr:hypothetical protein Mrose_03458 [Calidithermus roseus]
MARCGLEELGRLLAGVEDVGAALLEATARRRVDQVGWRAAQEAGLGVGVQLGDAGQKPLGVGVEGMGEEGLEAALLADLAAVHHRDAVAKVTSQGGVVGDEEHRQAQVALEVLEQVDDLGLHDHVQGAGGLVEDDQRGLEGQGHGDDHPLLHAARKLVGVAAIDLGGQPDALQKPLHLLPGLGLGDALQQHPLGHLVAHPQHRVEGVHGPLEDHRDTLPAQAAPQLGLGEGRHFAPLKAHTALVAGDVLGQQAHQRHAQAGLAAARLPDQAQHLPPGLEREGNPVHRPHRPLGGSVVQGEVLDF